MQRCGRAYDEKMKVVESGMPEEEIWGAFFKPEEILGKMGLSKDVGDIVDFGSGYGSFTIPAAEMVSGTVYAIDIEEELVESLNEKIKVFGARNVNVSHMDLVSEGSGLDDGSVDYVMLFNILHGNQSGKLLSEAYRILRTGGRIGVIHWNYDPKTPRGPPMELRLEPEQIVRLAENINFKLERKLDLKPYHFGVIMKK